MSYEDEEKTLANRSDILVESFRAALRIAERYLFIALATAAVAFAIQSSSSKTIDLFNVHLEVPTNQVTLASFAVSWCTAWLSWVYVRHAARIVGISAGHINRLEYETALAVLTHPSLFTLRSGWMRWLIIFVTGCLILSAYGEVYITSFPPSWLQSASIVFLELPYVLMLFSAGVKFRDTKQNALMQILSRMRSQR
ncbi:hypothetical protein IVB40_32585 [Bradyrhizobium sp. 40]|uniref:hypothetical protein n=1 Tax=Bradyrhizobium sp. 40 TaxID=2782674 RepID=UPI001FFECB4D|nr:hypothetical protein [Bradyrhizobium sp. 40]UPJ41962.1 hypothetical protein IVB40_32585 [Bradyrhizobium sp. 40]